MKLDFSEVKENKSVPAGEAELTIKSAVEKKSQNGTNMLTLGLEDAEGGFVMDNVCLEGPGAFRAEQLFNALGLDADTAASMEASDLVGMNVTAVIVMEEYNGEERSKVKKYIA